MLGVTQGKRFCEGIPGYRRRRLDPSRCWLCWETNAKQETSWSFFEAHGWRGKPGRCTEEMALPNRHRRGQALETGIRLTLWHIAASECLSGYLSSFHYWLPPYAIHHAINLVMASPSYRQHPLDANCKRLSRLGLSYGYTASNVQ